jgi:hypothetical protein
MEGPYCPFPSHVTIEKAISTGDLGLVMHVLDKTASLVEGT